MPADKIPPFTVPPLEYKLFLIALAAAAWGGVADYFRKIQKAEKAFEVAAFVGHIAISGFTGMLAGVGAIWLEFGFWPVLFITGAGGAMGDKLLAGVEIAWKKWASFKFGVDYDEAKSKKTDPPNN